MKNHDIYMRCIFKITLQIDLKNWRVSQFTFTTFTHVHIVSDIQLSPLASVCIGTSIYYVC